MWVETIIFYSSISYSRFPPPFISEKNFSNNSIYAGLTPLNWLRIRSPTCLYISTKTNIADVLIPSFYMLNQWNILTEWSSCFNVKSTIGWRGMFGLFISNCFTYSWSTYNLPFKCLTEESSFTDIPWISILSYLHQVVDTDEWSNGWMLCKHTHGYFSLLFDTRVCITKLLHYTLE